MHAAAGGGRQREDGGADIAAHLHVAPALLQQVGDERGGGGLAVGAGDGDEGRMACKGTALAAEQLDVADDLDARFPRPHHAPVRLGMGQRHAGREDEAANSLQSASRREATCMPAASALARPAALSSSAITRRRR